MLMRVNIIDPSYLSRIGKEQIDFESGVNILVGSNGSGKSSLFTAIADEVQNGSSKVARLIRDPNAKYHWYSGETATVKLAASDTSGSSSDLTKRHASHGQGLTAYLDALSNIETGSVVFLDEPETALDFFAVEALCQTIASKKGVQWIIATHSPLIFTMRQANIINLDREKKNYHREVLTRMSRRLSAG